MYIYIYIYILYIYNGDMEITYVSYCIQAMFFCFNLFIVEKNANQYQYI